MPGTTGQCLCGAVRYSAEWVRDEVSACHCGQCRRWAGGPFMPVATKGVRFEGEENLGRYRSSDWAERGFCKLCGSSLFYRRLDSDAYMMTAGSLDDQSGLSFTRQVFVDEKPDWYDFAQETKTSTAADFFARNPQPKGG